MGLVSKHLPKHTAADYAAGLKRALQIANGFGLTSLQEASASEEELEAYADADAAGSLTARVNASIYVDTEKGVAELPRLKALRSKYRGKRLRADGVKIFADGVLETRTAAVLEPYIGFGDDRGKANLKPADLQALAAALDKEGFQIHIHAIGDRGIRDSLDALEAAQKANGRRDARHHVAHLELIEPPDIPRFRRLGVVANFQPLWANGDRYITELTEPFLGPERSRSDRATASFRRARDRRGCRRNRLRCPRPSRAIRSEGRTSTSARRKPGPSRSARLRTSSCSTGTSSRSRFRRSMRRRCSRRCSKAKRCIGRLGTDAGHAFGPTGS